MPLVGGFGCLELVLYGIRISGSMHGKVLLEVTSPVFLLYSRVGGEGGEGRPVVQLI